MRSGGVVEVAARLGLTPRAAAAWARRGRLPVAGRAGQGPTAALIFDLDEVERMVTEGLLQSDQRRDASRAQAYRELRALGLSASQVAERMRLSKAALDALVARCDCYTPTPVERVARRWIDRWTARKQVFASEDFPWSMDVDHVQAAIRRAQVDGVIVSAGRRRRMGGHGTTPVYAPASVPVPELMASAVAS